MWKERERKSKDKGQINTRAVPKKCPNNI